MIYLKVYLIPATITSKPLRATYLLPLPSALVVTTMAFIGKQEFFLASPWGLCVFLKFPIPTLILTMGTAALQLQYMPYKSIVTQPLLRFEAS